MTEFITGLIVGIPLGMIGCHFIWRARIAHKAASGLRLSIDTKMYRIMEVE